MEETNKRRNDYAKSTREKILISSNSPNIFLNNIKEA